MPSTMFTGADALTTGIGLLHAVLALVFWVGRRTRRDWGLGWLALAFAAAAVINLAGSRLEGAENRPLTPAYLLLVGLGTSVLASLVVGVRAFIGWPSSWRHFVMVVLALIAVTAALRLTGLAGDGAAGHVAAASLFVYLALLAAGALQRVAGPANVLVLGSMLIQPVLVATALSMGMERVALTRWSAVAFAMIGLGLLVAGLGRYHLELKAELARRRQAEDDLRQLNASLERRIDERTQELQAMVGGLESFNRMVSHDLRGPLGGLAGLTALARQAAEAGDTERLQRMLALMGQESHRLVGLVSDLLTLARVNHAELELQPTPLDGVLDEALQALAVSLGPEAVGPVVREPLPEVRADRSLLRQVFINLIANSLKFSAGQPDVQVRVRGDRQQREVVIEVRDNGVGFPPERAAELFTPFRRLHGKDYEGSGIGLTIVRRIVERHGGRVWAEGRPGAGASVFFALPARPRGGEGAGQQDAAVHVGNPRAAAEGHRRIQRLGHAGPARRAQLACGQARGCC